MKMFVRIHNDNCVYVQVIVFVLCFVFTFTIGAGDTFVIVLHMWKLVLFVFSLPVDQNTILP